MMFYLFIFFYYSHTCKFCDYRSNPSRIYNLCHCLWHHGSLTKWARAGVNPTSSQRQQPGSLTCWATRGAPPFLDYWKLQWGNHAKMYLSATVVINCELLSVWRSIWGKSAGQSGHWILIDTPILQDLSALRHHLRSQVSSTDEYPDLSHVDRDICRSMHWSKVSFLSRR